MDKYQPVSCAFFDMIEDFAEKKEEVRIEYYDNQHSIKSTTGHITNIFTEDKQEFLMVDYGDEIRLDKITGINGKRGPAS